MLVKAVACIRNEDMICDPGKVFELHDSLAAAWIKDGWVVPVKRKAQIAESIARADATVEFAAAGPAEQALSPRGRRRRHEP